MAVTVDGLINELDGMKAFLESLEASGSSPDDMRATKTAMMKAIVAKVHLLPRLEFHGGARLTEAVTGLANADVIDDENRNLLTTALIQKMQGDTPTTSSTRRSPQLCLRADRYLIEADWRYLESTENMQSRLCYMRELMHKVGVTNPTESTLQVLVAIVCCARGQDHEPPVQRHEYYKQLKALFQSFRQIRPEFPHLVNYPSHPKFLDVQWRDHAYSNGLPPDEDLRAYAISFVAATVPCRSNNMWVRGTAPSSASPCGSDAQHILGQLAQVLQGAGSRPPSPNLGLPGLQIFGNAARKRQHSTLPLPIGHGEPSSPPPGGSEHAQSPSVHGSPQALLALPAPSPSLGDGHTPGHPPVGHGGGQRTSAASGLKGGNGEHHGSSSNAASALEEPRCGVDELAKMEEAAKAAAEAKKEADKTKGAEPGPDANQTGVLKKPAASCASIAGAEQAAKRQAVNKKPAGAGHGHTRKYSTEWSRNQIVCDSGIEGPGRYRIISFKKAGDAKKATAMADKWLATGYF